MKQLTKRQIEDACLNRGQIPENVPLSIKIQWAKLDYMEQLEARLLQAQLNDKSHTMRLSQN